MDATRFDRAVLTFGREGISRRRALQALLAAGGGGALIARTLRTASAAGKCEAQEYRLCCQQERLGAPCSGPPETSARAGCRLLARNQCAAG